MSQRGFYGLGLRGWADWVYSNFRHQCLKVFGGEGFVVGRGGQHVVEQGESLRSGLQETRHDAEGRSRRPNHEQCSVAFGMSLNKESLAGGLLFGTSFRDLRGGRIWHKGISGRLRGENIYEIRLGGRPVGAVPGAGVGSEGVTNLPRCGAVQSLAGMIRGIVVSKKY